MGGQGGGKGKEEALESEVEEEESVSSVSGGVGGNRPPRASLVRLADPPSCFSTPIVVTQIKTARLPLVNVKDCSRMECLQRPWGRGYKRITADGGSGEWHRRGDQRNKNISH